MFRGSDPHTDERKDVLVHKVGRAHLSNVANWTCSARRRVGGALVRLRTRHHDDYRRHQRHHHHHH